MIIKTERFVLRPVRKVMQPMCWNNLERLRSTALLL